MFNFVPFRFHAYAVVMEMETFERVDVDNSAGDSNLVLKKKAYGGVPRGAGVREDVILLFEELEEAKSSLAQLQAVMKDHLERSKTGKLKVYLFPLTLLSHYGICKYFTQLIKISCILLHSLNVAIIITTLLQCVSHYGILWVKLLILDLCKFVTKYLNVDALSN